MTSCVVTTARSVLQTGEANGGMNCLPEVSEQGRRLLEGLNDIVEEYLPPGEHFWIHEHETPRTASLSV